MLRHNESKFAEFRPSGKGGGSKPGKLQSNWPIIYIVAAEAIWRRLHGTMEACLKNRKAPITHERLWAEIERYLPGAQKYANETRPGRATPHSKLLHNRVYKIYYSGSSDRGPNHDPKTRASLSREQLEQRLTYDSELWKVHDQIYRQALAPIENWQRFI